MKHDFNVLSEHGDSQEEDPLQAFSFKSAIDDAISHGFVLVLLSESSLNSLYVQEEILYSLERAAASHRSNVVPIIISQFARHALPVELQHIQYFDLTRGPFDDLISELVRNLMTRDME